MPVVQPAICTKIAEESDKMQAFLDASKQAVLDRVNSVKNFLHDMTWSTTADVLNSIQNVIDNAGTLIPDLNEWDNVINTMIACDFLKKTFPTPTSVVNGITEPIINNATNGIVALGNHLPEFTASKLFDDVSSSIEVDGVNDHISDIEGALACLSSICGVDITDRAQKLHTFIQDCSFKPSGELDFDKILSNAGITDPAKLNNINDVKDTFGAVKTQVVSKTSEGIDVVKFLSKDMPF
jgi:hypothetical protein